MNFFVLTKKEILSTLHFGLNDSWNLLDKRFGPSSSTGRCLSCNKQCFGHYAHLLLKEYIPHPLYKRLLEQVINMLCSNCGYPLTEKTKCPMCNFKKKGIYYINNLGNIKTKGETHTLLAKDIKDILAKARDDFGFPDNTGFILRYILIPPTRIRSTRDPEFISDLHIKYSVLIDVTRGKKSKIKSEYAAYSRLLGTEKSEGINLFLTGNGGIFRNICLGKRLEKSAQSIIICDTDIGYDQVLVPAYIHEKLFQEIAVDKYNKNGKKDDDLWSLDKHDFSPKNRVDKSFIQEGMKYLRRIKDKDMVIINRQPLLTSTSVMAFRAKLDKTGVKTLSINPLVAPFFNADFDGNEMNLFIVDNLDIELNKL